MDRRDFEKNACDEELALRYFKGDNYASLLLWDRYGKKVWNYIYLFTRRNYHDSCDAYQEVCLRFLKCLKDKPFKEKGIGMLGFLRKVAHNTIIDDIGRKKDPNNIPIVEFENPKKGSRSSLTPFENTTQSENFERLMIAMTSLPDRQRDVIILRYFNYKTLREIGIELKISEAAACKILKTAKTSLSKTLSQGGINDGTE